MCSVTEVSELITDSSADPAALEAIRRGGTEIVIAGA
jgi:DeoR family transcriptional regulator, aga operon transcriptional repressor